MSERDIAVWLVDDDASIRWVLEQSLREAGMRPTSFEGAAKFLSALKRKRPDAFSDALDQKSFGFTDPAIGQIGSILPVVLQGRNQRKVDALREEVEHLRRELAELREVVKRLHPER